MFDHLERHRLQATAQLRVGVALLERDPPLDVLDALDLDRGALDGLTVGDDGSVDLAGVENRRCAECECEAKTLGWFHEVLPDYRQAR
jgi:hypothetical protein